MMVPSEFSENDQCSDGARPATVLLLGFPRLAKPLVDSLSDDHLHCVHGRFSALRVPFCDLVYQIGGGPFVRPRIFEVCKLWRRRVVKHWVGSDVLRVRESTVTEQNGTGLIEHWAVSSRLVEELAQAGISAKEVHLSELADVALQPVAPGPLTVLSYIPNSKFDFYGGDIVFSLAERFADTRFLVVGGDGGGREAPANVEFLGYRRDMAQIYARSHVLLRLPRHDGLSFMVLEALNHGREVIWNLPFEASRLARTENEAAAHLRDLRDRLRAAELVPNVAGREYVLARHSAVRTRRAIRQELLLRTRDASGEPAHR